MTPARIRLIIMNLSKYLFICSTMLLLTLSSSLFAATPSAYFKFNENSYNGTAGEVKDSSANARHGQANIVQPVAGKVCNAADMLAANTVNDYIAVPPDTFKNKEDFSIAFWLKAKPEGSNYTHYFFYVQSRGYNVLTGLYTAHGAGTAYPANAHDSIAMIMGGYTTRIYMPYAAGTSEEETNLLDDTWHHIVWTHNNSSTSRQACLYIDGKKAECIGTYSNSTATPDTVRLGARSVGGNLNHVYGLMDEFAIFDSVLTQTEVTTIYNNGNNGNNVDGSDGGYCGGSAPAAVLHYEMDEKSWAGNAGEVKDEINNLHATAVGGAKTSDSSRAITGDPGTCGYGFFDGVDDYISVADNNQLDLPALTISAWINPVELPTLDLQGIVSKGTNYEFNLTVGGGLQFWSQMTNAITAPAGSISAGQWTHVAVTVKSGKQVLYINGVAQTTATITGNLPSNAIDIRIGADDIGYLRYFKGYIDEVKIFDNAMTAADVLALKNETHPCPVAATEAAGYHLEDHEWSNSAGQVNDYISNHDGRPFNNLAMLDPTPALTGDPGTCAYGDFNGTNQYIKIPNSSDLNVDGSFSIAVWVKNQGNSSTYPGMVTSRSSSGGFALTSSFPGNVPDKWYFTTRNAAGTQSTFSGGTVTNNALSLIHI